MGLKETLERLQHPEQLVDPQEIVNITTELSGYITDFELEYDEKKLQQSFLWEKIKYEEGADGKPLTDKQTDIHLMQNPLSIRLNQLKRSLGELKRYRNDLNRKLDIIMNVRRYR